MTTKNSVLLKHSPAVRAHLRIYQSNAKARGIAFVISDAEAIALFDEPCHYCGEDPEERAFSTSNKTPYTANLSGIDRKDPAQPYTRSNTVACCKACNIGKRSLGYDEFLRRARKIAALHP